jgi:pilus assembly protein CpaE
MLLPLRLCLYDVSGECAEAFFSPFSEIEGVRVVAQCGAWADVQQCLSVRQADVVVVNLVGSGATGVSAVQHIAELAPDVGILGVGAMDDADTIIAAMRAGCAQFARYPIEPDDLAAALAHMRGRSAADAPESRRIVLIGAAGGAGASTVAVNLALELAAITGRRCGLIDLDLEFGDLGCMLDVVPKHSIADVAQAGLELDQAVLEGAFQELPGNIALLARPEDVRAAAAVGPEHVDQLLRLAAHMFPFIIIDAQRGTSPVNSAALGMADRVLILMQLSVPQFRNAIRVYHWAQAMGVPTAQIELVLNRSQASFENVKIEDVEKQFGRKVFAVVPNDYKRITAARDLGRPVVSYAPNSPARLAIQKLAGQLVADYSQSENSPSGAQGGGLLGRIFKGGGKTKAAGRA